MTKNFNLNTEDQEEWLTPLSLIQALGKFDLDPCAPPPSRRLWDTAKKHYSKEEHGDGLSLPWPQFDRVWLNPPYGKETWKWLNKLALHKYGIALVFARTETVGFHEEVWNKANGIFFFKGRIKFGKTSTGKFDQPANAPSCLVSYSSIDTTIIRDALKTGKIHGKLICK